MRPACPTPAERVGLLKERRKRGHARLIERFAPGTIVKQPVVKPRLALKAAEARAIGADAAFVYVDPDSDEYAPIGFAWMMPVEEEE